MHLNFWRRKVELIDVSNVKWFFAKKIKADERKFQGKEGTDEEIIKILKTIEIKSKKVHKLDIDCLRYAFSAHIEHQPEIFSQEILYK